MQTQLVAEGLETETARKFLESMPTADALIPSVPVAELDELTPYDEHMGEAPPLGGGLWLGRVAAGQA